MLDERPPDPVQALRRTSAARAGFALLVIALAAIGYGMLWTYFPAYDDEGYIILSAQNYSAQGHLYDHVYSQYGPAFYVLTDGMQQLWGGPITHTFARGFTLVLWLGTAVLGGRIVGRFTESLSLPIVTTTATFLYLYFVPGDVFHPGLVVMFALAGSLLALMGFIARGRWQAAALTAGAISAILVLTKINVGVFYAMAVVIWGVQQAKSEHLRRCAKVLSILLLFLIAPVLMKTLWGEAWITTYLVVFGAGAIALVRVLPGEPLLKRSHAIGFGVAFTGVSLLVLALVWLRGTSVAGLVRGVLLDPLRHAGNYSYGVDWRPGTWTVAGVSLCLALAHGWIERRFSSEAADRLVVFLRLMQTIALLVAVALLIHARVIGAVFSYVAPSIWIWAVPLRGSGEPAAARIGRSLLAMVLLLQYLHAYPIGGIQESWGTFLFFPLVGLGLGEIRRWCSTRTIHRASWMRTWQVAAGAALSVAVLKTLAVARDVQTTHAARIDLQLPGAEHLRLPEPQRTAYRILALNAAVHADVLFSLPGMLSFNLWTGRPTPTEKNTTVWFTLLTESEQGAVIAALERSPRACVIVQQDVLQLLRQAQVPVGGPLCDYLLKNYSPQFRVEGFGFMVRNGRTIAPLNIVEMASPATAPAAVQNRRLIFRMAGNGAPVAAIEARSLTDGSGSLLALGARNTTVTLTLIDGVGRAIGETRPATWPLEIKGLNTVTIELDANVAALPAATTVFYLKDSAGKVLDEARMSH